MHGLRHFFEPPNLLSERLWPVVLTCLSLLLSFPLVTGTFSSWWPSLWLTVTDSKKTPRRTLTFCWVEELVSRDRPPNTLSFYLHVFSHSLSPPQAHVQHQSPFTFPFSLLSCVSSLFQIGTFGLAAVFYCFFYFISVLGGTSQGGRSFEAGNATVSTAPKYSCKSGLHSFAQLEYHCYFKSKMWP